MVVLNDLGDTDEMKKKIVLGIILFKVTQHKVRES